MAGGTGEWRSGDKFHEGRAAATRFAQLLKHDKASLAELSVIPPE